MDILITVPYPDSRWPGNGVEERGLQWVTQEGESKEVGIKEAILLVSRQLVALGEDMKRIDYRICELERGRR